MDKAVQNVYDNILNETGFYELTIEQMYAVRNKLNRFISEREYARAKKRSIEWETRMEETRNNFKPNPEYTW